MNENQVIAIEDLNVRGMVRNRRLSRAVGDVGVGELRRQLEYKAEWYGRDLYIADRWVPTSKQCSGCGHKFEKLSLSTRTWTCPACGADHGRDINAAKNILVMATAGRAESKACGGVKTPETVAA